MKETDLPPRLTEAPSDPRLAKALRLVKGYEPPKARLQNALSKFEASRGSEVASGAAQASKAGWRLFSPKAGLLIAVVLAIGTERIMHVSSPAAAPAAEPMAPSIAVASSPAPAVSLELPARPTVSVDDLPSAPVEAKPLSVTSKRGVASAESGASFDDELALVEQARTALASGDASSCLGVLDRYSRVIRGGVFEREVAVMRIEALLARGERARAKALGETFLAKNPNSPYTDRVRSLVTKASTTP